jgi:hypothetical protein
MTSDRAVPFEGDHLTSCYLESSAHIHSLIYIVVTVYMSPLDPMDFLGTEYVMLIQWAKRVLVVQYHW